MENSKKLNKMGLIYAYIVSISFLNIIIGKIFDIEAMVFNIVVLLIVSAFNIKELIRIRFKGRILLYIVFVCSFYIVPSVANIPRISKEEFYFYFLIASIYGLYKCETEKFLRYIMYISLLLIPFGQYFFGEVSGIESETGINMARSFAMIPMVVAGIMHLTFYRRKRKWFDKVCYLVDIYYLLVLIIQGTRSIAITTLVLLLSLYVKNFGKEQRNRISIFRFSVAIVIIVVLINNFYQILNGLDSLFSSAGIEANFIEKTLRLDEAGDISNGRNTISEYVSQKIWDSPIWGHGASSLSYNTNGRFDYPHNFILQLFYDGGILLAIPILYILYRAIKQAFFCEDKDEGVFLLYMVLICVPKMLFSTDMWENAPFWLLIAYTLNHHTLE